MDGPCGLWGPWHFERRLLKVSETPYASGRDPVTSCICAQRRASAHPQQRHRSTVADRAAWATVWLGALGYEVAFGPVSMTAPPPIEVTAVHRTGPGSSCCWIRSRQRCRVDRASSYCACRPGPPLPPKTDPRRDSRSRPRRLCELWELLIASIHDWRVAPSHPSSPRMRDRSRRGDPRRMRYTAGGRLNLPRKTGSAAPREGASARTLTGVACTLSALGQFLLWRGSARQVRADARGRRRPEDAPQGARPSRGSPSRPLLGRHSAGD